MSWIYNTAATGVKGGTGAIPSTGTKNTYKPAKKIKRPKLPKSKSSKSSKGSKSTSDMVFYPPADVGRPQNPRTRNDNAVSFGRKAGTALSGAIDDAMPLILEGDYEGAYEMVLSKLKGQMLDTVNRVLSNYGMPPVDENGPDTEYWIAAIKAKSGLDISDLSIGGLKDYGQLVLFRGIGKSIGVNLDGCTGIEDAVNRCLDLIDQGQLKTSLVLTAYERRRAEIARALKDSGMTWEEYNKALNRKNASEGERK